MSVTTLSVVMPNYNDADYIGTSLTAICEQSFPPAEVIVIDNCSTDSSIAVIKEMAAKYPVIRWLQNEENYGFVYSVNKGARLATGEYLCVASANDLIYPGFFEKSIEMLLKYPQAGLCCTDFESITVKDGSRMRSAWLPNSGYFPPQILAELARLSMTIFSAGPNSVLRRSFLPTGQIYPPEIDVFGDWFLSKAVSFRHGCCYIPEALVGIRRIENSLVGQALKSKSTRRRVCESLIRLFASPDYEDIAPLMIRSRSLRSIEFAMRTPPVVLHALITASSRNRYAGALFFHLTVEYINSLCEPAAQPLRPVMQRVHDICASALYFLKNLIDRGYAMVFHQYDKARTALRRQLGL